MDNLEIWDERGQTFGEYLMSYGTKVVSVQTLCALLSEVSILILPCF